MGNKGSKSGITKGKLIGGSMGGWSQHTKGYAKRLKEKKEAEEAYWASLAGPVTITYKESK